MSGTSSSEGGWPSGWLIAAGAGFVGAILARWLGDASVGTAIMFGLLVFLVFGVLLGMFWGGPSGTGAHDGHGHGDHGHGHGHGHGHAPVAAAPMPKAAAPEAPVATARTAPPEPARVAEPASVAAAPVMAEPVVAPQPVAEVASVAEAVPVATARVEPAAATTEPAPSDTAPAMVAPSGVAEAKPAGLTGPRDGKGDDLQVLEGIGPAMEKLCHDLGIFHFDQIAGWGVAEIAWMDSNLKGFRGRVTRDKWVRQAQLIGEVGVEEFKRRAKTNDY